MSNIIEYIEPDKLDALFKEDKIKQALNHNPPQKWVKQHPYIKNHWYLPIDKVEYLLDKIFKQYRIEVLREKMMMNAITVSVRVHYRNLVTDEMDFHDGVGACELQTMKDTGSLKMDMTNIQRGAVSMALPIAKTIAVKDACDHLGQIFGRNLNRKDVQPYEADTKIQSQYVKRIKSAIDSAESQEQIDEIIKDAPEDVIKIVQKEMSNVEN